MSIKRLKILIFSIAVIFFVGALVFISVKAEKNGKSSIVSSYVKTMEYVIAAQDAIKSNAPQKDKICNDLLSDAQMEAALFFVDKDIYDYDAQFIVTFCSESMFSSGKLNK